jgi:hypothetical protein
MEANALPCSSEDGRTFKKAQMQGARRGDSEAYDPYTAGRHEEGNDADEPFSTSCYTSSIVPR